MDDTSTRPLPRISGSVPHRTGHLFSPDMVFADSHAGLIRKDNQDSFAYHISPDGNMVFMMVADGIGGNEGGDLASRFASETMLRDYIIFQKNPDKNVMEFLKQSVTLTNSALQSLNLNFNVQHSMGTTVSVLILTADKAYIAHAGDSRIYRLRSGAMTQLTTDHTIVSRMIRLGELTEEEAKNHPYAHIICQAIGVQPEVQADYLELDHIPGDRYLVCSDGIMLHLQEQAIQNVLASAVSAADAVKNLVTLSLRGGGGDNTTAVCAFT